MIIKHTKLGSIVMGHCKVSICCTWWIDLPIPPCMHMIFFDIKIPTHFPCILPMHNPNFQTYVVTTNAIKNIAIDIKSDGLKVL
jgi:hypothetical protein